jgi:predicted Zn-dependent protease
MRCSVAWRFLVRNYIDHLQHSFQKSSDAVFDSLNSNEDAVLSLQGEDSFFARFNNSKIRQNTSVEQAVMSLQLQCDGRTLHFSFSMTGQAQEDMQRARHGLAQARHECRQLPVDPFQVDLQDHGQSQTHFKAHRLDHLAAMQAVAESATRYDLTGIYVGGEVVAANRNSKGQSHFFSTENFYLDYSLYSGEKAVKSLYAGGSWVQNDFLQNLNQSENQLHLMGRSKKTVPPGQYRVYLAPSAVAELLGIFSWGALAYADYQHGNSAFRKLADKEKTLSALFHLRENFGLGLGPRFNAQGELASEQMDLIKNGSLANFLINSRSAKEFSVQGNCANESESPRSLELLPGELGREDILKQLGTGLYLSNLHYLNWSDRINARVTGMTRYACFWVEQGEIVAPIEDMRFDESIYDCFGTENLLALTDFQELDLATDTYERRSLGGKKIPGVLLDRFTLTL